ncbi:MAG TPA: hypothetical protein VKB93_28465 [Thermoanaerobaculia bacterium]|nr:hypothetical protein [Thermoanaerobaculia bacterium]
MAQQQLANQPFPCLAGGLIYKAYARSFQPGAPPVLYVFASGYLWNSVSRIFFARQNGLAWTLLQETPNIIDNLLIYYAATATTSQPILLQGETTVAITDGFGTHQVPIEPWPGTDVEATPASADYAVGATATTQLSRGSAISYLALSRPYDGPGDEALALIATCYYPTGQWHIFFTSDSAGYNLMETVPGMVNMLVTYYVAGFSSGGGLQPMRSVNITDGYGTHAIPVTRLLTETGDAPSPSTQQPRLSV